MWSFRGVYLWLSLPGCNRHYQDYYTFSNGEPGEPNQNLHSPLILGRGITQLIPHHLFCWWSEAPKVFWHTTKLDIQRGRFVAFAQSITGVRDTSCWNPSPKTFHAIIVVTSTSIPGEAGPRSASEKTCSEIFNLWNLGGLGILVNRHHGIFPTPSPPNDDTQTPIRIVTIIVLIGKSYNIFGRLETCVTSTDLTKDMDPPKKILNDNKNRKKTTGAFR